MDSTTIAWVNLAGLHLTGFLMPLSYILSLMPATQEQKKGEHAWTEATRYRWASNVLEWLMVLSVGLWIWYPVPALDWKVHDSNLVGIVAGLVMGIPLAYVDLQANLDLGKEGFSPSRETQLAGGIYRHIRHPQMIGEIPLFVAGALCINSAFLALWFFVYVCIYIPVVMHFEEKDLVRRFGQPYVEYRERTGAIFPRLWGS
jgi:protein-S-isoprenylcysteine O-methyltransferase Ste14